MDTFRILIAANRVTAYIVDVFRAWSVGQRYAVIQDEATSCVLERLVRITSSMLPNDLEEARDGNLARNWQICR